MRAESVRSYSMAATARHAQLVALRSRSPVEALVTAAAVADGMRPGCSARPSCAGGAVSEPSGRALVIGEVGAGLEAAAGEVGRYWTVGSATLPRRSRSGRFCAG